MEQRKYGLFTAIAMIVGIVIGSGIFFKSYNILYFTGGNVSQGVLALSIAAVSIVFGCLAVSELASRTDNAGGVITYSDKFWNKKVAIAFGWFHMWIYYPTLTAIIAWIAGVYINILFGWENTIERQVLISVAVILILYLLNMISAKLGGGFQRISVVIKMIPLVLFGIAGMIWGNPGETWRAGLIEGTSGSWLAAIPAVLYAYDGWIVATTICHEIKDSKRNLYLALIISPLLILLLYIIYFVGMSAFLGPEQILALGNDHLAVAATKMMGNEIGAKLIILLVIISVLGTDNGMILGFIRMPYSLALRKMMPNYQKYTAIDQKHGVPIRSGIFSLAVTLVWVGIHYVTQKFIWTNGLHDISEIAMVVNYMLYFFLYAAVIKLAVQGEIKNILKGWVIPILAMIGAFIIVISGFQNELFGIFLVTCAVIIGAALIFAVRHPEIETVNLDEIDAVENRNEI